MTRLTAQHIACEQKWEDVNCYCAWFVGVRLTSAKPSTTSHGDVVGTSQCKTLDYISMGDSVSTRAKVKITVRVEISKPAK